MECIDVPFFSLFNLHARAVNTITVVKCEKDKLPRI